MGTKNETSYDTNKHGAGNFNGQTNPQKSDVGKGYKESSMCKLALLKLLWYSNIDFIKSHKKIKNNLFTYNLVLSVGNYLEQQKPTIMGYLCASVFGGGMLYLLYSPKKVF